MPVRPSFMSRLLWDLRRQQEADAEAARSSARYGLQRRQELAAQLACRPSPSPVEVSTVNPPTRKDVG